MIKVMVVDDSAFMRKAIKEILENDSEIKVVETARNGQDMFDKLDKAQPDVITLDINMPVMDGKAAIEKMREDNIKIPVIVISSLTKEDAPITLELLDLGAFDFVAKPSGTISLDINKVAEEIIAKVKNAYKNRRRIRISPKFTRKRIVEHRVEDRKLAKYVVAIGISTGGPATLLDILQEINEPDDNTAFLVVQHMPPQFTPSLAKRLTEYSPMEFFHASPGQSILGGYGYLAPGGWHMMITKEKKVRLFKDDRYIYYPSVDVLFDSVADVYAPDAIGVLLTGIGKDGAAGLLKMKKNGCYTIAEDEETAVVYGMPRAAKEMGAAIKVLPSYKIARDINVVLRRMTKG